MDKDRERLRTITQVVIAFALVQLASNLFVTYKDVLTGVWSNYGKVLFPIIPFLIVLILILWLVPKINVISLRWKDLVNGETEFMREKERLTLEDNARKTLAQILGGIFIIGSLIITYNTYRLSLEGQLTQRYSTANSQLESTDPQVRSDALVSLEQIIKESPDYQERVMKKMFSFIRAKSPRIAPAKTAKGVTPAHQNCVVQNEQADITNDIQMALNMIGNIKKASNSTQYKIDLSGTNLQGADLSTFDFSGTDFSNTNLRRAILKGTVLSGAYLIDSNLSEALISDNTDLTGTYLSSANLTKAILGEVKLVGLKDVEKADFGCVDLSKFNDIKYEDLKEALIDEATTLPEHLKDKEKVWLENSKRKRQAKRISN